MADAADSLEDKVLGQFRILSLLGKGSMGAVYKAEHPVHGTVALKILLEEIALSDTTFVKRFEREARTVRKLRHPNIVGAYEAGVFKDAKFSRGICYIAMEFVDGKTLQDAINENPNGLPEKACLVYINHVLHGLAHASSKGVVHRDIKPANIMVGNGFARLADFGLVKLTDAIDEKTLTQTGFIVGTPLFLSPEQCKGEKELDVRSDIYSLGATLFNAAAGRPPYRGVTPIAIMARHVRGPVPDVREANPEASDGLNRIIKKAMAKERKDRYQTPEEMMKDITSLLNSDAIVAGNGAVLVERRLGYVQKKRQKRSIKRWIPAIAAGGLAVAGGAYLLFSGNKPSDWKPAPENATDFNTSRTPAARAEGNIEINSPLAASNITTTEISTIITPIIPDNSLETIVETNPDNTPGIGSPETPAPAYEPYLIELEAKVKGYRERPVKRMVWNRTWGQRLSDRGEPSQIIKSEQDFLKDINSIINHKDIFYAVHTQIASLYLMTGDFGKAVDNAKQALEFNPSFAEALYVQGLGKLGLGDKEGAQRDLENAFMIEPRLKDGSYKSYTLHRMSEENILER